MEKTKVFEHAARGAGHVLRGETRERLAPLREQFKERSSDVQSRAGLRILKLAERIRNLGNQLHHEQEAQMVARRLEETADYVRFRPVDDMASDAAEMVRRHPVIPVLVGLTGALIAYKLLSRRRQAV